MYEFKVFIFNINTPKYWVLQWEKELVDISSFHLHDNKYNKILSLVPKNSKVLDVGCGIGLLMERLSKENCCNVTGVDMATNAVESIKRRGMQAVASKIPPIPFADKYFDVVIATEFLEHFRNPLKVLDEILRVMIDDGMFIISIPDSHGPGSNKEHLRSYTEQSLRKLISKKTDKYKIFRVNEKIGWQSYLLVQGFKKHCRKHVLFLRRCSQCASYGGAEKIMIEWFQKINYEKVKVTIAVCKNGKNIFFEKINENNLPVEIIEFPLDFNKTTFLSHFFKMSKFLRKIKPAEVIYVQGGFKDFKLADVLAGFIYTRGKTVVYESAGAPIPERKISKRHFGFIPGLGLWWYRKTILYLLRAHLSKKIIAISHGVKERMVKLYRYPKHRIHVVYHGVDTQKFSPNIAIRQKLRKKFGIPEDHTIVVSTSRLAKEKCLHRLINAFDIVCKNFNRTWLFIIGYGDMANDLVVLANKKLSRDKIIFLGFQNEISDFLKMCDIFVLPSDNEGLALAMLESMSTGHICVVTKTTGPNEIIKDGTNGFLVDRSEEGVLNGLIKALSLSQKEKMSISNNARSYIREKFDINKNINDELKILGL